MRRFHPATICLAMVLATWFSLKLGANSAPRSTSTPTIAREVGYVYGPMCGRGDCEGARLVPFRAVSKTGELTTLPGIAERRDGDKVFRIVYADGSELWLTQKE